MFTKQELDDFIKLCNNMLCNQCKVENEKPNCLNCYLDDYVDYFYWLIDKEKRNET